MDILSVLNNRPSGFLIFDFIFQKIIGFVSTNRNNVPWHYFVIINDHLSHKFIGDGISHRGKYIREINGELISDGTHNKMMQKG